LNLNEKKKISKSLDFLLTLRCFSHYISQRQNDKLTFGLQKIIADKIKTTAKGDLHNSTELLMKDYFKQIKQIKTLAQVLSESVNNQIRNKKVKGASTLKNFQMNLFKKIFKNNFSKMSILTKNSLNFSNPHSKRKSLSNLSPIKKLSPDFGILFMIVGAIFDGMYAVVFGKFREIIINKYINILNKLGGTLLFFVGLWLLFY